MKMHEHMAERVQLAGIYAEDGAYFTAARILQELAETVEQHARRFDADLRRATSDPINLQGSGPAPIALRQAQDEEG